MSRKTKRGVDRAERLTAARAELALTLEDKLLPHHMHYNLTKTRGLTEHVRLFGDIPMWAYVADDGYDDKHEGMLYAYINKSLGLTS